MSEGQRQKQQHYSRKTASEIETSEQTNPSDSTGDRKSNRRARAGALLAQVYERGPKGGISPQKVLFEWTKELVSFHIPRSDRHSPTIHFFLSHTLNKLINSKLTLCLLSLQVKSIQANKDTASSNKAALDLLEAIKFATNKGPVVWDQVLVDQVVKILQSHRVRSHNKFNISLSLSLSLSLSQTNGHSSLTHVRFIIIIQTKQFRYL